MLDFKIKKMKNSSLLYTTLVLAMCLGSACTKLDEKAYDVYPAANFYNSKNEVLSAVLRPYTHAGAWSTPSGQDNWWRASEMSADQLAWPTKGRHGEDGGKWKRSHYHTWTVDEAGLNQAWSLMYAGIGYCNDPIGQIDSLDINRMGITQDEKEAYLAELKLFRAYHYLKVMDIWGNVPIATKVADPIRPNTSSRQEVFTFIEKEIKENIDKVPVLSTTMIGRMTKAGGYAMLVELYLNAEVWTGTPRWDDCIAAADALIANRGGGQNGAMALDTNIVDQFKPNNNLSKEVIFSIAYDFTVGGFEPQWPDEFYHFKQREIYGGGRNGNDGIVLIPGVYTTYTNADARKKGWFLQGPMVKFTDGTPVLGSEEYSGEQLKFVDSIQRVKANSTLSTMSEGEENSGVRFNKYKLGNQAIGLGGIAPNINYNNTDWNIYRLTWIYFAKAEAIMRKNGGAANAEAVKLINDSKKRSFSAAAWPALAYTPATLTMDELLAERGREFIFEGFRRDDLIRFKKFTTGTWWDHKPTTAFKELYPIPQVQRNLNANLTQNPGYN
jgi:hypothetical protein